MLSPVTTKLVVELTLVGVPEITPVESLSVRPAGRGGTTVNWEPLPGISSPPLLVGVNELKVLFLKVIESLYPAL